MTKLIDALTSWPMFLAALLMFGVAPRLVLRLVLLAYPKNDPRRAELMAELRAIPRVERPVWVAEQIELALAEGLPRRFRALGKLKKNRQRKEARVRRGTIRKGLTTLSVSGAVYLITSLYVGDEIMWSVMLSVFIGGVLLVVQFLAEFENRLQTVENGQRHYFATVEDQIKYGSAGINDTSELFGRIEDSAIRADLKRLIRNSANLDHSAHTLIHLFASSEIARLSELMKGLSERGEITYDGEGRDSLLGLTRNAQATIDAVSFMAIDAGGQGLEGGGLWKSDFGQRYLEAQQKALERKVMIRRIFVLDDTGGAHDPERLRMCEIQRDLGILVRILDPPTLPCLRQNWMYDFIVFDSAISFESTPAVWAIKGTKPAIARARLVLGPQRVADRLGDFAELWAAARELDG